MALFSALSVLAPLLLPPLKVLLQWVALPALSALTAALLSLSGVSCYAAWLLPPVVVSLVPWLIIGYPLTPSIMLLCALTAMIGASFGEVLRKRRA